MHMCHVQEEYQEGLRWCRYCLINLILLNYNLMVVSQFRLLARRCMQWYSGNMSFTVALFLSTRCYTRTKIVKFEIGATLGLIGAMS